MTAQLIERAGMDLMDKLEAQVEDTRDVVVPAVAIDIVGREGAPPVLTVAGQQGELSHVAQEQVADYLDVPRAYWRRMASDAPHLVTSTAATWIGQKPEGQRRLVRFKGDTVRSLHSSRYRRLDNLQVLHAALPGLREVGAAPWPRYTLNEQRMHVTFVCNELVAEMGPREIGHGHTIKRFERERLMAALTISNSEVGRGRLVLRISIVTVSCTNLAIGDEMAALVHLGKDLGIGELVGTSERTALLEDALLLSRLTDGIRATFNHQAFAALVGRADEKRGLDVYEPVEVLQRISKKEGLEEARLLNAYMEQPEPTAWGIVQAVTRSSRDGDGESEGSVEASRLGGKMLGLDADDLRSYFKSEKRALGAKLAEEEKDEE